MQKNRCGSSPSLRMAQSRPLSLTSKLFKLEKDVKETEKQIIAAEEIREQAQKHVQKR